MKRLFLILSIAALVSASGYAGLNKSMQNTKVSLYTVTLNTTTYTVAGFSDSETVYVKNPDATYEIKIASSSAPVDANTVTLEIGLGWQCPFPYNGADLYALAVDTHAVTVEFMVFD